MQIDICIKEPFAVIGREGSTEDGQGFIETLWADANAHFGEVQHLAKRDDRGNFVGFWGAMSDFTRSFLPWEDHFSRGLYLAGVECEDDSVAPDGWTKWHIPGYEYLCVECTDGSTFSAVLDYMREHSISLVGAVHDFNCPVSGKNYLYFPIRKISETE